MQGGRKVDEASKVMGRRQAGSVEADFTEKGKKPLRILSREVTDLLRTIMGRG